MRLVLGGVWMVVGLAACTGVASSPPVARPFPFDPDGGFVGTSTSGGSGNTDGGLASSSSSGGTTPSWEEVPSPTTLRLHAVTASGANAVAVGENGVILELRGGFWTKASSPTSETLWAVAGNGGETYAVGNNGTVVRSNGASWTVVPTPTTLPLNGVRVFFNDVVVVGGRAGGPGVILERQGNTWTDRSTASTPALFSVGGVDTTAWALAEDGRVLTRETAGWFEYGAGGGPGMLRITGRWPRAYSVGLDGTARVYDNRTNTVSNVLLPTTAPLLGITLHPQDSSIWACGEDGTVVHAPDQGQFSAESLPLPVRLWGVAFVGNTLWAVGENGALWRRE